jgi:Putative glycolipid-binding
MKELSNSPDGHILLVLTGKWAISDGAGEVVGSEVWRLKEENEAVEWTSTIDRKTPFPHVERLLVRVLPHKWDVRSIEIVSQSKEGPEEFFRGFVEKGMFRFEIQNQKGLQSNSIQVNSDTEYDYLSPIFNTVTFHRLRRLRRGQSREVRPLFIDPVSIDGSFNLHQVRQRYTRTEDQDLKVSAGQFNKAKNYRYENLESGWKSSICTDNLETVLRYEKVYELTEYRHSA